MASSGVNVLRWGALVFGVFYGFSHQSAIHSHDKKAAAQHEWSRKEKQIADAKAAWVEKTTPPKPGAAAEGSGATMDPDDPKFDLEAYLTKVSKDNP